MSDQDQSSLWWTQLETFPDQELKLHRPMRNWFARWIKADTDLNVAISMSRVLEAVLDLHIDTKLRKHLGENHAKNFENARRSKHSITATTKTLLEEKISPWTAIFPVTPLEDPDGALAPEAHQILAFSENIVTSTNIASRLKHHISCPYCHHDSYIPAADWWGSTELEITDNAALAIDRLLLLSLAAHQFFNSFFNPSSTTLTSSSVNKAYPNANEVFQAWNNYFDNDRLPIAHWVDMVKRCYDAVDLGQLSGNLSYSLGDNEKYISHSLLRKWTSGQQLPPSNTALAMTSELDNHWPLKASYYYARLNMLTLSLTLACAKKEVSRQLAQTALNKRLHMLRQVENSIITTNA